MKSKAAAAGSGNSLTLFEEEPASPVKENCKMPTYTVHAPPESAQSRSAPERFVFVRDGFHFWAFLCAPLWMIVHRLWLVLIIYVFVVAGIFASILTFVSLWWVQFFVSLAIALLAGLEASTLRRWTMARRGWKMLGFVIGDGREDAEWRFFDEWTRGAKVPESDRANTAILSKEAVGRIMPMRNDVIGLFPEPGT
jgi:hypothetical protein